MVVYIALLFLLCILYALNQKRNNKKYLMFMFITLFLIYALRNIQVGRDISGYQEVYMLSKQKNLTDFNYVYFEPGYTLFMGLCSHVGISFQWFLVLTSFIILFPVYLFIKNYSEDYIFSVVVYVCYIFFEFNLSALRQAIATSIVLCGLHILFSRKKFPVLQYLFFVLLATTFHQSAALSLIFVPLFFFKNYKFGLICILLFGCIMIAFRSSILSILSDWTSHSVDTKSSLYFGGDIIFLMGMAILFVYALLTNKIKSSNRSLIWQVKNVNDKQIKGLAINAILTEIFLLGIVVYFVFGFSSMLRATQYASIVILVLLPNSLAIFQKTDRLLIKIILLVFFVAFFIINTLVANNLDIVPYKFFWN